MRPDGSRLHCAVGPEQWEKGGHHTTWFPDGRRLSMNLNIDRDTMRLVQVDEDGANLRKMHPGVRGSGHPTLHPDGRHVLTDTYTREADAYGDGTVPLRWIDLATGTERRIVRFNTAQPAADGTLRVDPHPAWDRSWRFVAFNGFVGGTRRVLVADLGSLVAGG
jgi:Tol biopolymer transport system component